MRLTWSAVTAASLAAALGATGAYGASTHSAAAKQVTVGDDFYSPGKVSVKHGRTVTWTWKGSETHTVTDRQGRFGSKAMRSGNYRHKFTHKGTYHLYCEFHPDDMNMTVVVK